MENIPRQPSLLLNSRMTPIMNSVYKLRTRLALDHGLTPANQYKLKLVSAFWYKENNMGREKPLFGGKIRKRLHLSMFHYREVNYTKVQNMKSK